MLPQCKALAAAIFGSATSTLILPEVSPADRFIALNNGTVDVLASWTTYTMERQVYEVRRFYRNASKMLVHQFIIRARLHDYTNNSTNR